MSRNRVSSVPAFPRRVVLGEGYVGEDERTGITLSEDSAGTKRIPVVVPRAVVHDAAPRYRLVLVRVDEKPAKRKAISVAVVGRSVDRGVRAALKSPGVSRRKGGVA